MALGFATGLSPTYFCIFLQDFAHTNEKTVRRFMLRLRRFCSCALWWPIWSSISCRDKYANDSNTTDDLSGGFQNGADDVTGYRSDIDRSGSSNIAADDDDDRDGDDVSITS